MVFNKILRVGEGRQAKKVQQKVQLVNARSDWAAAMSDDELKAMTASFKDTLDNGADLDDIAVDAFAVVRDAGIAHGRSWHGAQGILQEAVERALAAGR